MNEFEIDILTDDELEVDSSLFDLLTQTVITTLQQEHVIPPISLSLLLTTSDQLHQLNRDFLGFDKPTDVLSFPAGDPMPNTDEEDGSGYLGDIAIAMSIAQNQADTGGHTLAAECQLLAVHGILHLLGYDHLDRDQKAVMWSAQEKTLKMLEVNITLPD